MRQIKKRLPQLAHSPVNLQPLLLHVGPANHLKEALLPVDAKDPGWQLSQELLQHRGDRVHRVVVNVHQSAVLDG